MLLPHEHIFVELDSLEEVHYPTAGPEPAGAPNDGLGLTEVWGYGLLLPESSSDSFYLDQVRSVTLTRIYLPTIKTD